MLFGDIHAVEQEPRLPSAHAANDVSVHRLRADGLHVSGRRQQRGARREPGQLMKAPAIQWQIDNLLVADHLTERRRLGVQQGRLRGDLHFGGYRAEGERQLHANRLTNAQLHAIAHGRLEALNLGAHPVGSGIERRDDVLTLCGGRDGPGDVCGEIRHRDRRARYPRVLRIVHGTEDASRLYLRQDGCASGRAQHGRKNDAREQFRPHVSSTACRSGDALLPVSTRTYRQASHSAMALMVRPAACGRGERSADGRLMSRTSIQCLDVLHVNR